MSSYSTYISSASKAGNFSTHWNCHHCSVDYHHLVVVGIIILVDIDDHKNYHKLLHVNGVWLIWIVVYEGEASPQEVWCPWLRPASPFQPSKAGTCADDDYTYIQTKTTATTKTNDNMNTLLWMYGAVGSYLLTMPTTNMQTKTTTTSMRTTRTISWWIPCPEYMKW